LDAADESVEIAAFAEIEAHRPEELFVIVR
jgi:hypothetical protein